MTWLTSAASPQARERQFFVWMATAIATTIVAGFGLRALRSNVPQPVPLHVHLHGLLCS
jgi:uncharacterized membrane protein YidH (DUF202 family)